MSEQEPKIESVETEKPEETIKKAIARLEAVMSSLSLHPEVADSETLKDHIARPLSYLEAGIRGLEDQTVERIKS